MRVLKATFDPKTVCKAMAILEYKLRFKKVSIVMCYALTNTSKKEDKNSFYAQI